MNYYLHYPGDYARDTAHLTLAEHGAYRLLLDHYYSTEAPIPGKLAAAYRIAMAQTDEERAAVESVIGQFFVLTDGRYHNPRADTEIPKAQGRIERARENGKLGGRPPGARNKKTQKKPSGLATENPVGTPLGTPAAKLPNPHTPIPNPAAPNPGLHSGDPLTADPPVPAQADASRRRARARGNGKAPSKGTPTWEAYSAAFEARYGVGPPRNAKTNSLCARLVDRLGAEEAPAVAAWYVGHPGQVYTAGGHCLDLLVRDAEKLRTECVTGRRATQTRARQEDRRASNAEAVKEALAAIERTEATDGNG